MREKDVEIDYERQSFLNMKSFFEFFFLFKKKPKFITSMFIYQLYERKRKEKKRERRSSRIYVYIYIFVPFLLKNFRIP